jgi:hypothetical protein
MDARVEPAHDNEKVKTYSALTRMKNERAR